MAQVIFLIFYNAYPKSKVIFRNDKFKEHVLDLCALWTLGLKPSHPAQIYEHWNDPDQKRRGRKKTALYYDAEGGEGGMEGGGGGERKAGGGAPMPSMKLGGGGGRRGRRGKGRSMLVSDFEDRNIIRTQRELGHSPLIQHYVTSRNGPEYGQPFAFSLSITEDAARPVGVDSGRRTLGARASSGRPPSGAGGSEEGTARGTARSGAGGTARRRSGQGTSSAEEGGDQGKEGKAGGGGKRNVPVFMRAVEEGKDKHAKTYADMVEESRRTAREIKERCAQLKASTFAAIKVTHEDNSRGQKELQDKRKAMMAGDISEQSNYLVSLYKATQEESGSGSSGGGARRGRKK
jgi:hypothetical protein